MPDSKIFNLLPADRRRALESEVATSIIRAVLLKNHGKTFGTLVDNLQQSEHWEYVKGVKVSSILTPATGKRSVGRPRKNHVAPEVVEAVLAAVKKNPGLRSEELQKKLSMDAEQCRGALAQLRRDGRVKTSGSRRVTTYKAA